MNNILDNDFMANIREILINRLREEKFRKSMNRSDLENMNFPGNNLYQKQMQAILETKETPDMTEYQRALLYVRKKDAYYELHIGQYETKPYDPDLELSTYERQNAEAHELLGNRRSPDDDEGICLAYDDEHSYLNDL
jgi:hypothetical protein